VTDIEIAQSFQILEQRLAALGGPAGAAEAHGMVCGLLCAGADEVERRWFAELFPEDLEAEPLAQDCREDLHRLLLATRDELEGPGLGLRPLLPADDTPLGGRAQAVSDWCEGFLYGLGLAGMAQERLTAGGREALRDLAQMTHIDVERLETDEADEEAYAEIAEFVWVAAMLIYHDLATRENIRP
jgi:uncharacterized protein